MGSAEVIYDKREQLQQIKDYLLPGEQLYAVFDLKGAGTGYLGITDRRIVFMDRSFIRKRKSIVTIPYNRITALGCGDEEGVVFKSSELTIIAASHEFEYEFRGIDKARKAYELIASNICQ